MSGRPNAVVPGVPARPNSPRPRNRADAPDFSSARQAARHGRRLVLVVRLAIVGLKVRSEYRILDAAVARAYAGGEMRGVVRAAVNGEVDLRPARYPGAPRRDE